MAAVSETGGTTPRSRSHSRWYGRGLILLGLAFLLDGLHILHIGRLLELAIPVGLIGLGLWWVDKTRRANSGSASTTVSEPTTARSFVDAHELSVSRMWGDVRLRVDSQEFRGGRLSALVGDIDLDLSDARIAPGTHRLMVTGLAGKIRVQLPPGVSARVQAHSVFGDMRSARTTGAVADDGGEQGELTVLARQVFGNVVVE